MVTTNQTHEALTVLEMMGSPDSQAELQEVIDSIHLERGAPSEPLFQAKYKKPLLLAVSIGLFNQLSGINAILYYSNFIFSAVGFSSDSAALQAVGIGLVNLIATFLGMSLIDKSGRKSLLLIGAAGMTIVLLGVAAIFRTHSHQSSLVWLLVLFISFFASLRAQ